MLDLPRSLNGLIEFALRVDARLSRMGRFQQNLPFRGMENPRSENLDTVTPICDPEPMQVGRARLSREERERRRSQGLCLYCGKAGHFITRAR